MVKVFFAHQFCYIVNLGHCLLWLVSIQAAARKFEHYSIGAKELSKFQMPKWYGDKDIFHVVHFFLIFLVR